jgi:beta-lactamase class A
MNTFLKTNNKSKGTHGAPSSMIYKVLNGVMVCALLFTYFWYIPHQDKRVDVVTRNPFLNPALAVLDKDNLIVNFQGLRDSLTSTYENRDDYLVSIYFEYLPTGANIAVNKDEKIWPASLIKIPVAMAIMKKVQEKKWKLSNELVILDQDKDSEYGAMYKEPTGTTHTIKTFLEETLINSDNTAHFVLLRNLDGDELEDVYIHLGMDDIIDALKKSPTKEAEIDNRITAKRYSIFFRSLYNATYLTQEYSQLFLSILEKAPRELLSRGIPDGVSFVHKTGIRIDEGVRADSGIVYIPGRPYILTVMVQQKKKGKLDEEDINKIFEAISKEVYTYVANAH